MSLLSASSMCQSVYHDNGDCNWTCEFCDAFFWFDERLKAGPAGRHPKYSHWCRAGRVMLPYPRIPPKSIIRLFQETDFQKNVKAYNSMFSMTSFGAKVDDFINDGSGPYVFKVEVQIYHWIGSLCPPPNEAPRFLQMYVYDTDNELSNRIGVFSGDGRSRIKQENVRVRMDVLTTTNELVKLFRTAKDLCSSSDVSDFSFHLYSSHNAQSYDKPSSGSIGAIIPDGGSSCNSFDVVIRHKNGVPQRISKLHQSYMPLQYPFFFYMVKVVGLPIYACVTVTEPTDIDSFVSAEIPNPNEDPLLYKVVTELMIHGPCGLVRPSSTCMFNGSCSKGFPKDFQTTTFFDKKGYVHYRRRPSGFTVYMNDVVVDSRYVVPCSDRVRYNITKSPNEPNIQNEAPSQVDEIQNFVDGRFICPHEATLRIFNFPIHERNPPVQQKVIYDDVLTAITSSNQILAFVYGHGGTRKTFLWSTIISAICCKGDVVLAVAASGIASLLLPSGRTTHSRFKIPLDLADDSLCDIKKNTHLSLLITEAVLIIWDEAPMSYRRCFESLNKSLQDILDKSCVPFGGKSMLLGGDFRQTLPIVRKASISSIIASSLPNSYLWRHFKIYQLTQNMRLQRPDMNQSEAFSHARFSSWLISLGDGKLGIAHKDDPQNTKKIQIPSEHIIQYSDTTLSELKHFIYDAETLQNPSATTL
ncbi:uncharacterized protein LOC143586728 [Bidens hawaiensis]|uniref:uncharacterized protein LOC143586728 n=1 Tax=Bidens hawaiensis TaxID=980011 RepID=UPI00404B7158